MDLFCKDTYNGDTPMHVAVKNKNYDLVRKIFELKPEHCLTRNYDGENAIFIATRMQDMEMLDIFEDFKFQSL